METPARVRRSRDALGVARVTLARPGVRNAFDDVMIRELGAALRGAAEEKGVRVLVLDAEGTSFCAGADLQWMKRSARFTEAENRADAMALADLLEALDTLPIPTVARVQGPAMGGGVGLAAACDVVIAAEEASFALSEARLGLAPAVISPYVLARIGPGAARELFLTAAAVSAARARELGLVNRVVPGASLDEAVAAVVGELLACGPGAQAACKELIRRMPGLAGEERKIETSGLIARLRAGREGQEGMAAFLERRRPSWRPGDADGGR